MTDMQDWTPWAGGRRPHPPATCVRVRYRDGTEDEGQSAFPRWWHDKNEPWRDIIAFRLAPTAPVEASGSERFQDRCGAWLDVCFGPESRLNVEHRNARFLEEAVELVQASGMTETAATDVVCYAFGRPQGEINQEVGGVMMTLAAHCLATGVDMTAEGERELARVWTKVDQIRAKEAAKPSFSALHPQPSGETGEAVARIIDPFAFSEQCRSNALKRESGEHDRGAALTKADKILDLIRPAPVASGGQHSSGEVTVKGGQWEPHTGQDYAVVMLPDENTETASIHVYSDDEGLPQRIADALNLVHLSPTPAQDDDKLRIAVEALEPFAALAAKFGCWSMVEVCAPDPDNPSPVIAPVPLAAFENAARSLAALKSEGK